MKNKLLFGILAIVLVFAIAGVGLWIAFANFRSTGVHIQGDYVSVQLEMPCYVYDLETETFLSDSTITWDVWGKREGDLLRTREEGLFSVAAYPIPADRIQYIENYGFTTASILSGSILANGQGAGAADEDGYHSGPVYEARRYQSCYDLETGCWGVYITSAAGERVLALAGFESQETALAWLRNTPYGQHLAEMFTSPEAED